MAFRIPFLSKIPANAVNTSAALDTTSTENAPLPITEELFIDRDEPGMATELPAMNARERWATEDMTERGYHEGYKHHDPEARQQALDTIKATIRAAVERDLSKLVQTLNSLEIHIQECDGGGMDSIMRMLHAKKAQLQDEAMKLGEELLQVMGGGGCAELPCASFTNGFNRGYKAYLAAEFLTNTYTAR